MREEFDPSTIEDEGLRQVFLYLMNVVENLSAKVAELTEENQRLRDENNRLKGEQGKPRILPNKGRGDRSSEKERRESRPHHKDSKQAHIPIDREVVVKVDHDLLPADAQFKGYMDVVVQDIEFRTDTIRFRKEKYSSPSQKRTDVGELKACSHGQFGPGVRAWVLSLYYAGQMSEPKILEVLHTVGLCISAGQLSDLLIKDQEPFHVESAKVLQAGLSSCPWHHLESTGTRVNGQNQPCHVLCNPLDTAYCTTLSKDRMTMLRVLLGGADLTFRLNEVALELLPQLGVGKKWCTKLLAVLPYDQECNEQPIDALLDESLPTLGPILRKGIKDALAIAAYRTQTTYPVVDLLICDDAPQFNWLTAELALCWIHEYRHYRKLGPRFAHHCHILDDFSQSFWKLYRTLLAYREHPSPAQAEACRAQFDQLFGQTSGYQQLDECQGRTLEKRDQLLMVLSHPEILLHHNPAELGARQRVRKRDVSLQARTKQGIGAWDTFQTLVSTANKLGINISHSFHDRIAQTNALPSFASLIQERAKPMA